MRLPPKKKGKGKKPYIKYHEFELLVNALPEPISTMVFVCVLAALRVSELIGLKRDDIGPDFIMVDERYCRGDWSQPKTEASCAPVAVAPRVIERILALKDKSVTINWGKGEAKKTIKLVRSDGPGDLVFTSLRTGVPMSDHNMLSRYLRPIAKKLGLGRVNWQVLRRSYPTWMVANKADPKSVQAQMRHASLGPTLGIYAQVVSEAQRASVDTLMADMDRESMQSKTTNLVPIESELEHELEHKGQDALSEAS